MKAVAVHPGTPDSMHLREIPEPAVGDIPGGRGVKVQVLRVGVDGTDREIGLQDFTTDDVYYERGISHLHGFLTEYYVEDHAYVFALPESLAEVGVLRATTSGAAWTIW